MIFDIHIFGVRARQDMIDATATKLSVPNANIHYDERPGGGAIIDTAKKAWFADIPEGITHRIVLQDDVEVCNGFCDICTQIIAAHPEDVVSLFPFDYPSKRKGLAALATPYVRVNVMSACGIIMPIKFINPCFDYISENLPDMQADDDGIKAWGDANGVRLITTLPGTIQHIGDVSIGNPKAWLRRTAYYEENPVADWGCRRVATIHTHEWFFANHGKPWDKEDITYEE